IGASPQYFRLMLTALTAGVLFGYRQLKVQIQDVFAMRVRSSRVYFLAAHVCAVLLFYRVTATVLGGQFGSLRYPALWTAAWLATSMATMVFWGMAMAPATTWYAIGRNAWLYLLFGLAAGTLIWAIAFASEELWRPLAGLTFRIVGWLL